MVRQFMLVALLFASAGALQAAPPDKAEVAAFAERMLADNCDLQAPGMAVLVARGDEVLFRGACGRASLELDVPLAPEQVFRIGSVTKQMSAAAVLKLAEDGRLALHEPLTKYVPGYPGGDAITVAMLLDHTSGIRSYTDIPGAMAGPVRLDVTTAELIDAFKDQQPDFAPGEGWSYNNSGYVLVGAVIEAASGMSWHAYLQDALFAPLGMAHTRYGNAAEGVIPGHVSGYTRIGERWAAANPLSMTQPHAAGALVSTVDDLLRWNRALHAGRVLHEDSYRRMVTPAGKAAEHDYGYGIVAGTLRGQPVLQHGGGIFGFSSYLLYLPDSDLSVAVLYNADAGRPGMLGTGRLGNLLAAHAIGRPYPEKTPIEMDPDTLREYEGVYRIDDANTRVLRVSDGGLTSQRTGGPAYALIPVAPDTFLFEEGFSRMVLERDAAGRVRAMRFYPEDEGEGEVVERTDEPLPAARDAIELPAAALERLVGEYVREGMTLTIVLEGGTPKAQLTGQPAFEIFAESPSRFFLKVVDATLEFAPASGRPDTVTLHQGGAVLEFRREDRARDSE
ncbi:serine hydrolase [Luteimonas sp. SJ-92]|uniref:Serine hydrolase n=1 Tax=Luteimonas salinisoli TaxID=2752307 RepID=A0A853JBS6_9GAMM|nr:serine hydrolase [Luteimonas salinisoli]NZA26204.1 serine hydrolase [Luteimonas salinisoli]